MRYAPAAAAVSLAFALSASGIMAAPRVPAPRAVDLIAAGEAALTSGDTQGAADAFEAALTVEPGYNPILLRLAEAARAAGLPGKAISYYREALAREPTNIDAIAGEGAALAEKGALGKAREKLALVQKACAKDTCPQAASLTAAIARGPVQAIQTAEAKPPGGVVSQVN